MCFSVLRCALLSMLFALFFFFFAHPEVPDFSESFKMLQPESIELRMTVKASPRTAGRDIQVQDTFSRISEIPFPPLGSSKNEIKKQSKQIVGVEWLCLFSDRTGLSHLRLPTSTWIVC